MKDKKRTLAFGFLLFALILYGFANPQLPPNTGPMITSPGITRPSTNQTTAMNGDISPYSVTSYSQTNPADGQDFWPDGFNYSIANSKDYHNFAGIGDFVGWSLGAGESKGTTGDYAYIICKYISGVDDWSGMYTNRPSFTGASLVNTYLEIRYKGSVVGATAWRITFFQSDSMGGDGWGFDLPQTTTWSTYRVWLGTYPAYGRECFVLCADLHSGQSQVEIDYDYCLMTPAQLGGWQFDCSHYTNMSSGAVSLSADGDKVTATATSGSPHYFYQVVDNTALEAGVSTTLYPLLTLSCTAINAKLGIYIYTTSSITYAVTNITATGIYTYNLRSIAATDIGDVEFHMYNVGDSVTLDYVALYAIANFTTTITGASIYDTAYVSSNALCVNRSSATFFQFQKDQTVSIAQATFNKWNISTTASASAVGLSCYNGTWNTKDYQTAGIMPSGTTTSFILRVFSTCTISSVKFITWFFVTNTIWSSVSPTNPTTQTPVILTAVVTNSSALYAVYFHSISYPAGFSGSDYRATLQQLNLWNYVFSSLPLDGYYSFCVIGSTGSTNTSLGANSYITFYVAVQNITITTVTLCGQSSEFQQMEWSFYCNMVATLTIYEGTSQSSMTATHSISVIAGLNAIAWTKFNAPNQMVYVNATFISGSLSMTAPMFYAVAPSMAQLLAWLQANISLTIKNMPGFSPSVGLFDPGTVVVLAIGSFFVLSLAYMLANYKIKKAVNDTIRRLQRT